MSGYKYYDDDYIIGERPCKPVEVKQEEGPAKCPEYKTYQVSRWVEQWQTVIAKNKEDAIEVAREQHDWNENDILANIDEAYKGYSVMEIKD